MIVTADGLNIKQAETSQQAQQMDRWPGWGGVGPVGRVRGPTTWYPEQEGEGVRMLAWRGTQLRGQGCAEDGGGLGVVVAGRSGPEELMRGTVPCRLVTSRSRSSPLSAYLEK